jgi:zinc transport system substrate-binding protein
MEFKMKTTLTLNLLIATSILSACTPSVPTTKSVVATLFPQFSLADQLAGDLIDIQFLIPIGMDPHDFEPSPNQRLLLNRADLILFTSEDFEVWIHTIEETVEGDLIDLSSYANLIVSEDHDHLQSGPKLVDDHVDGDFDPHYWLDPANGLLMLEAIADALVTLLPEDTLLIRSREIIMQEAFTETIELYESLVSEGEELDVVFAGHNAFGYLTNYDVHVNTPYPGFSTDVLPTAQSLIDFTTLMTNLQTNIIYTSSTDNSAVIDALLESNPGIETKVLYTLENVSLSQFEAENRYQELLMLNYESLS